MFIRCFFVVDLCFEAYTFLIKGTVLRRRALFFIVGLALFAIYFGIKADKEFRSTG